ncbi:MAG TPA: radical SAM protein [bacterium]|nr:radical SAM protein [bacterium]
MNSGKDLEKTVWSNILSKNIPLKQLISFVGSNWETIEPRELMENLNSEPRKNFSPETIRNMWEQAVRAISEHRHPDHLNFYVHIPYCEKKCVYCVYHSSPPETDRDISDYVSYLIDYLEYFKATFSTVKFRNFYIGGGTPSILSPSELKTLLSAIRENYSFHMFGEHSMEVNPGSVTEAILQTASDFGINRISMGVQTFTRQALEGVNRDYQTFEMVKKAVRTINDFGFERGLSVDMITGLMGDTAGSFAESFDMVASLRPRNIIVYPLRPSPAYLEKYFRGSHSEFYRISRDRLMEFADLVRPVAQKHGYRHNDLSPESTWSFSLQKNELEIAANLSRFFARKGDAELAGFMDENLAAGNLEAFKNLEQTDKNKFDRIAGLVQDYETEKADPRNRYDDIPRESFSLFGIGPDSRSHILGTISYTQVAEPCREFKPGAPIYNGQKLAPSYETLKFIFNSLGKESGFSIKTLEDEFDTVIFPELLESLKALQDIDIIDMNNSRVELISSGLKEMITAKTLILKAFIRDSARLR